MAATCNLNTARAVNFPALQSIWDEGSQSRDLGSQSRDRDQQLSTCFQGSGMGLVF